MVGGVSKVHSTGETDADRARCRARDEIPIDHGATGLRLDRDRLPLLFKRGIGKIFPRGDARASPSEDDAFAAIVLVVIDLQFVNAGGKRDLAVFHPASIHRAVASNPDDFLAVDHDARAIVRIETEGEFSAFRRGEIASPHHAEVVGEAGFLQADPT